MTLSAEAPQLWLWTAVLGALLLRISVVDVETMHIEDAAAFGLIALGLLFAATWPTTALWLHVVGAIVGVASFLAFNRTYRWISGRSGMGDGDALLFAGAGAWLGVEALPTVAFIAAIAGLAIARIMRGAKVIPFAPALSIGHWAVWLHGPVSPGLLAGGPLPLAH